jgi:phospholipase/carboxylesterase
MPTLLSGPSTPPLAGGKPNSLVVLLHGVGSDGRDLINLVRFWASLLPGTEFIAPDAPEPCDITPNGRQWFSVKDPSPNMISAGTSASAPILDEFLDEALALRGLDESKVALVGFSQGTMMSLHVAPRRTRPLAGVLGFSGALTNPDRLPREIRSRPPVMLIHGDADPVVPFSLMAEAEEILKANEVEVETLACPGLGHTVGGLGLRRCGLFLKRVLGA